jgi:hypothetical protein
MSKSSGWWVGGEWKAAVIAKGFRDHDKGSGNPPKPLMYLELARGFEPLT